MVDECCGQLNSMPPDIHGPAKRPTQCRFSDTPGYNKKTKSRFRVPYHTHVECGRLIPGNTMINKYSFSRNTAVVIFLLFLSHLLSFQLPGEDTQHHYFPGIPVSQETWGFSPVPRSLYVGIFTFSIHAFTFINSVSSQS